MDSIQLSPQTTDDQTPTVDLGSGGFPIPSTESTNLKASKASFGLGQVSGKPFGDFYAQIANGQEPEMRQNLASTVDLNKAKRKQGILTSAVQSGATSAQLQAIATPSTATDPSSVIEEYSAARYFDPVTRSPDVQADIDKAYDAINAGVSNLAYKNYAVDRLRKSIDSYQGESWGSWALQKAKDIVNPLEAVTDTWDEFKKYSQIYSEYKLRGGLKGDWSHLLGTELNDEVQKAYAMPFDQFKSWYDQKMDDLDKSDPELAIRFGAAVAGQSSYDIQKNDFTTVGGLASDVATVASIGSDALALRRIRGAVQDIVKSTDIVDPDMAASLDRAAGTGADIRFNGRRWNAAPKDITPQDIKQAQASGHGNTSEAAIQMITQDIDDRVNGKPVSPQSIVKSIPDIVNPGLRETDGSIGTDVANRIREQEEARQLDFTKGVTSLIKVNRTPTLVASEDTARAARQFIQGKYAGINSTVSDTTGRWLYYDPASNTYHMNLDLVAHSGDYFESEGEAVSHAEMYGVELDAPPTTTRQYWDDEATAAAFEVDHLKKQMAKYSRYTKQQFKPKGYYALVDRLKKQNERKKNAWAQRAGAYWKPDQPIESKLGKITLEKQGLGWYIRGWVPVPETEPFMRSALLKTPNAWSGPSGVAKRQGTLTPYLEDFVTGTATNKFSASAKIMIDSLGMERALRSPEEALSPEENIQRKVAVHTPSKLMDMVFGPDVKILESVPAKYKPDLRRVLTANQTMLDPKGQQGHFFKTPTELRAFYDQFMRRFPTPEEMEGYFAYTGIYAKDWGMRTLGMLRNKWMNGVESHQIKIGKQWTDPFDGIIIKGKLPSPYRKSPIYIAIDGSDAVRASGVFPKAIRDGVTDGRYTVIKLWNREDRPAHKLSKVLTDKTEPTHIITDQVRSTPLDPQKQVPQRGGGHWVHPYDWYVKQANTYFDPVTKQWIYKGDTTALAIHNAGVGQRAIQNLNYLQNLIRTGDISEARDYARNWGVAGLNFDRDILGAFKGYVGDDGKGVPPRLNTHESFKLVPANKTIPSMSNDLFDRYDHKTDAGKLFLGLIGHSDYTDGLHDTTRFDNPARNSVVEFTQERDSWGLHTIDDAGTPNNPVWQYRPAQLADPIDVVSRGITRVSNSMWLDDMKSFSAEHWFETYKQWLKDYNIGSPFSHFINPVWLTDTPKPIVQLAMSNRKKAKDLISMSSPIASYAKDLTQDWIGSVYRRAGTQASNLVSDIVNLPIEHSPVRALNTATADLKLGLFAIPSFLMQMSAYANIAMFEPRFVNAATRAALFHTYARLMPQHIDYLDKIASKVNFRGYGRLLTPASYIPPTNLLDSNPATQAYWRPGHFKAIWKGLTENTDFANVGKEHAIAGDPLSDRYMRSKADVLRYWGYTFFREAAQFVRQGAYYTSALKWIEENEGRLPSTRDHWAQIQNYATDLDHNMSRASNSDVNTGMVMGTIGKFHTYGRNLAEDIWGKRFNKMQKTRMITGSGLLWGFPFGALGLLGPPVGYGVNKFMLGNNIDAGNYVPGGRMLQDMFMQGVPAYLLHEMTGQWEDVSRFGSKGWETLFGFISDDPKWWDWLGAMPTSLISTALSSTPLLRDIAGAMHMAYTATPVNVPGVGAVPGGDGDYTKFNPTWEDLASLLKQSAGWSRGEKMFWAFKTGHLWSNSGTDMMGTTVGQAITSFLTGMDTEDVANIGANFAILNDRKAQQAYLIRESSMYLNRANREIMADPEHYQDSHDFNANMRMVTLIVGMAQPMDQGLIWKTILGRSTPLIDAIKKQIGTGTGSTPADLEKYMKQLQGQQ